MINEDDEYIPKGTQAGVPRFTLKGNKDLANIPINKPLPPTEDLIIKAIKYGMIYNITYKGAHDDHNAGHERVIYPMVFGRSAVGDLLIRGYHLKGWSVSHNSDVEKEWRLFRFDRFKSITFTGSFYRLPPAGYNMHDKGIRGGFIARADFNSIRKEQDKLLKAKEIQNRKDIEIGLENESEIEFNTIRVKSSGTTIDLLDPYDNPYIKDQENAANLRLTFLKTIYGGKYICIMDALGKSGNTVKVLDGKGKSIGIYKVLDSIGGDTLKKIKTVKGNTVFDLWFFDKKI